jgi:hypothetical protein
MRRWSFDSFSTGVQTTGLLDWGILAATATRSAPLDLRCANAAAAYLVGGAVLSKIIDTEKALILREALQAAVPLKIWELHQTGADIDALTQEYQLTHAQEIESIQTDNGLIDLNPLYSEDAAIFVGGIKDSIRQHTKPGTGAKAFVKLVRMISIAAFYHDGIEVLGVRFSAREVLGDQYREARSV